MSRELIFPILTRKASTSSVLIQGSNRSGPKSIYDRISNLIYL